VIASINSAPILPHRIAALREEARACHEAFRTHERHCLEGPPECDECRRLCHVADRADERWSDAMAAHRRSDRAWSRVAAEEGR
jgi:hypothetical protein